VSERLRREYEKHNSSRYDKEGYSTKNALVRPKDPLDMEEKCGVIYMYQVDCKECKITYIGRTK